MNSNNISQMIITKFNNQDGAVRFASNGTKPLRIIMGDDMRYWICTPANAERLHKMGYEYFVF